MQASPEALVVKNPPASAGDMRDLGSIPVFLPGKFHGQRSLADFSPWGCKESDMTEQRLIHSFTSLYRRN